MTLETLITPTAVRSVLRSARRRLAGWGGHAGLLALSQLSAHAQVWLVGGAVRDGFLNRGAAIKDFDFIVEGLSDTEIRECLGLYGTLSDNQYGSPRWVPTSGGSCADVIPLSDFRPMNRECHSISEALSQFDFTANAVGINVVTGGLIDDAGGVRDACSRLMRMLRFDFPAGPLPISESLDRNAVLWFRIVHYTSVLGLSVEHSTAEWLNDNMRYLADCALFTHVFFSPNLSALDAIRYIRR